MGRNVFKRRGRLANGGGVKSKTIVLVDHLSNHTPHEGGEGEK